MEVPTHFFIAEKYQCCILNSGSALTAASRDLYTVMDSSASSEVAPIVMLSVLHNVMPQFAEKDEHGHLRQHDANEFWLEMLRTYQNKLKTPGFPFLLFENLLS